MKKTLLLLSMILFSIGTYAAKTYFVATDGNDTTGDGSITTPFATIMKAQELAVGGDTVYVRGGTYAMTDANITQHITLGPYAVVNYLNKSGTSSAKRICYWAYPGEKPVFDFSQVKPAGYRVTAFLLTGNYIHIKGLEVIGVQVTILTHTQSECFRNQGSYNIFEQLSMHDGMGIGFYQQNGSYNQVINCDAYRNWDNVSENLKGGNVDGFGFHPGKGYVGNRIKGCRAWFNSDDGYDCINASETIIFENCWAFYNGYSTSFASLGDGNGFKAGGYGQAPVVSKLPNPIPPHAVRFCVAVRNKANGFYANHHVETGSYFYNNTAYRNSTNYNMLSQYITTSQITGNDTTIDCKGIRHKLQNNVSFKLSSTKDTINLGTSTISYNSFTPNIGITVSSADFLNINEAELTLPRKADGSLPDIDFLHLNEGSDLIDAGVNLGYSFYGTAPDLGAFEFMPSTPVKQIDAESPVFYPNPVVNILNFKDAAEKQVEIVNIEGKTVWKGNATLEINVSFLPKGLYLIKVKSKKDIPLIFKMMKR